jgi:hypothetical protein
MKRLLQESAGACRERLLFLVGVAFARHHHDLERRLQSLKPLERRQTIHAGHIAIEENSIELAASAQRHCSLAVSSFGNLTIEHAAVDDFLHDLAYGGRIVDDQDLGRRGDARVSLHDADRVLDGKRLEQEFVGAQLDGHVHRLRRRRVGHQRHKALNALLAGRPKHLDAGELRHMHVDESKIDIGAVEQSKTLAPIVSRGQPKRQLRRPRGVGENLLRHLRVVGDQHGNSALHSLVRGDKTTLGCGTSRRMLIGRYAAGFIRSPQQIAVS